MLLTDGRLWLFHKQHNQCGFRILKKYYLGYFFWQRQGSVYSGWNIGLTVLRAVNTSTQSVSLKRKLFSAQVSVCCQNLACSLGHQFCCPLEITCPRRPIALIQTSGNSKFHYPKGCEKQSTQ